MEHIIANFKGFVDILTTETSNQAIEEARNLRMAFQDLREKVRE